MGFESMISNTKNNRNLRNQIKSRHSRTQEIFQKDLHRRSKGELETPHVSKEKLEKIKQKIKSQARREHRVLVTKVILFFTLLFIIGYLTFFLL